LKKARELIISPKISKKQLGKFLPQLENPDSNDQPKHLLDHFISTGKYKNLLKAAAQIEYHWGIIPSEGPLRMTVSDHFMIIGDAGGLISQLLGEGIRFAIDLGQIAGRVAGRAVETGDFSKDFLLSYQRKWKKKYEILFRIGQLINKRLTTYTDDDWDMRIMQLSKLDPELIPDLLKGNFTLHSIIKLAGNLQSSVFKKVRALLQTDLSK